jgi:cysteinyl-tRNA synthetase
VGDAGAYNPPTKEVGVMRLYNTLTRSVEPFAPTTDDTVRYYVCGPTVYDHLHVGNLRPIIVNDALRKYMEQFKGWDVQYVQNVTDVDDKLINRSLETGEAVEEIAARFTTAYFQLMHRLDAKPPTHSPRATDHIEGMVELVQHLIDVDAAYESGGDVYFRVRSAPSYGCLSGRCLEDQEVGARVEASEKKEHPLDFTLWKAAKPGEPHWPSPWGEGRPGWHTECVVLSRAFLGETFDLHAGGNDLIFPHHENEIAQAEAAHGSPFARFWLHNGMLTVRGEEMHKSTGNFSYAYEVLDRFGPAVVRYFYLARHYRKPLDFSEAGLLEAAAARRRLVTFTADVEAALRAGTGGDGESEAEALQPELDRLRERYIEAMDEDLNTVEAIAVLQDLVSTANRFRDRVTEWAAGTRRALTLLRELDAPLGLLSEGGGEEGSPGALEEELIALLIDLRVRLRENASYDLADEVRDRLAALGIALKDTSDGTLWVRAPGDTLP